MTPYCELWMKASRAMLYTQFCSKMDGKLLNRRILLQFRIILIGIVFLLFCYTLENTLGIRIRLHTFITGSQPTNKDPIIIYERCQKIPMAPKGMLWPEEQFLNDPEVDKVTDLVDPTMSRVRLEGSTSVKVGDTVKVKVVLYDGNGNKRTTGGDLIRVYLMEKSKGANSRAQVIDNKDGSYSAIATAFWEGTPEVVAVIISPREVIATAFKRRYTCPPVLMNSAIFQHPVDMDVVEETPCNYDSQVPGYRTLCNFTAENYGRPWYCGKPRHPRLVCQDWTMVADRNLWNEGLESQILSNTAYQIMHLNYTARRISANLFVTVYKGSNNESSLIPEHRCNENTFSSTWELTSPTGFFYQNKWHKKVCRTSFNPATLESCLKDTKVILIGDSTLRQMFEKIEKWIPCKWITDLWSASGKHRPAICENTALNFSLTWEPHSLPFCTRNTPRHYFKSFSAYLNEIQGEDKMIIVLHTYAHLLNHHSHVFYETLKDMKKGILGVLQRNKNAKIVIKGPHAFAFSKSEDHAMWMPDIYADIYQDFMYSEFKDISDQIIYLESMDMSVSTEQWHIHVQEYIVEAVLEQMFSNVCVYS